MAPKIAPQSTEDPPVPDKFSGEIGLDSNGDLNVVEEDEPPTDPDEDN